MHTKANGTIALCRLHTLNLQVSDLPVHKLNHRHITKGIPKFRESVKGFWQFAQISEDQNTVFKPWGAICLVSAQ